MASIKFGLSTIVSNGELKEIKTRSVAVNTEDNFSSKCHHAPIHCMGQCFWAQYPLFVCPCQRINWSQTCQCSQMQHFTNTRIGPTSCQRKASETSTSTCSTDTLDEKNNNRSDNEEEIHPRTCSRRKNCKKCAEKKLEATSKNVSNYLSPKESRESHTKLKEIPISMEDDIPPNELIKYANDFLGIATEKESNFDEEPDKLHASRTRSEKTFCYEENGLKNRRNNTIGDCYKKENVESKFDQKISQDSLYESSPKTNVSEKKPLGHLLKPSLDYAEDFEDFEEDNDNDSTICEISQFSGRPNDVLASSSSIAMESKDKKAYPKLSFRKKPPKGDGPSELPMMMMINTLVKDQTAKGDSKLNQLLNHIEKESTLAQTPSNQDMRSKNTKRIPIHRRPSITDNLKKSTTS